MNRPVFIDSSGFFAALDFKETHYEQARAFLSSLQRVQGDAVTTDHVIAETYTLLKARRLNYMIPTFHSITTNSRKLKIEWTDKHRFEKATAMLLRQSDKNYSFVDCLSFVVMHAHKLTEALTTDEHFNQAGFKALLAGSG